MNIPFRPILSALLRNRVGAVLVAGQIAIALAVLANAVYIVKQRVDMIGRPTGIDVENIFVVSATGFGRNLDHVAMIREDLAYLQSLPGIVGATTSNAVPLSSSGSSDFVKRRPDETTGRQNLVNYFEVTDRGADTLGVKLIAGRWFNANEVVPPPKIPFGPYTGPIVIGREYAARMFPNESALGKTLYASQGQPLTIIGVVDHMLGAWPVPGQGSSDDIMFLPRLASGPGVAYLVRTKPGMLDTVMRQVEKDMAPRNRERSVDFVRPLDLYVKRTYMLDRNMAIYLSVVTTLLLVITSLGIFGLATFNVSTRTKQVGTRRAVGARRGDVVLHFLAENWMITTAGVVLGSVLALAAGHLLSIEYRLPRVDLYYIVGGVLVLWVVGLAAAWYPARRAARISPALATRTV